MPDLVETHIVVLGIDVRFGRHRSNIGGLVVGWAYLLFLLGFPIFFIPIAHTELRTVVFNSRGVLPRSWTQRVLVLLQPIMREKFGTPARLLGLLYERFTFVVGRTRSVRSFVPETG